jgi:hypothetical protein
MNIFFLDYDPKIAAQSLCDKHCVKMILESAQIMSTAHRLNGTENDIIYKKTHTKHPCVLWTLESLSNYKWLGEHAIEMCNEYTYRYEKQHKSKPILEWLIKNPINIPDLGLTKAKLAMPLEFHEEDPVKAYRRYYVENKKVLIKCTWKKRSIPEWFL